MKNFVLIALSALLVFSILIIFSLFQILYYQWDWDKEKLQRKTFLIAYLDGSEYLKDLNSRRLNTFNFADEKLAKIDSLRAMTYLELNKIKYDLIEITGGLNEKSQYMNPKSKSYINSYFFEDNKKRPYAHQNFDKLITNYLDHYKEISGLDSNLNLPIKILGYYDRPLPSLVFLGMTLSESIVTIDLLKTRIEIDFQELLISSVENE